MREKFRSQLMTTIFCYTDTTVCGSIKTVPLLLGNTPSLSLNLLFSYTVGGTCILEKGAEENTDTVTKRKN
jgi:hypothetical protein